VIAKMEQRNILQKYQSNAQEGPIGTLKLTICHKPAQYHTNTESTLRLHARYVQKEEKHPEAPGPLCAKERTAP
jgi:hypothetical protein